MFVFIDDFLKYTILYFWFEVFYVTAVTFIYHESLFVIPFVHCSLFFQTNIYVVSSSQRLLTNCGCSLHTLVLLHSYLSQQDNQKSAQEHIHFVLNE